MTPSQAPRNGCLTRREFSAAAISTAVLAAAGTPARAQISRRNLIRFETDHLRFEIAEDGTVHSVFSKADNREYGLGGAVATIHRGGRSEPSGQGIHAAVIGHWVYRGGSSHAATRVERRGEMLFIEFAETGATARCRVTTTKDYLAFELQAVEGPPIDRIEFLRLQVRRVPLLGQWVGLAADDRFGVCLCGGTLQTDIQMHPREQMVEMTAAAEAAVGFRGATAVLFGCREPRRTFLDTMSVVERDFQLPSGATHRQSPGQRLSYLFTSRADPQNIGRFIEWAKLGGFRVLLISYRTFTRGAGHYLWSDKYPNGVADLKRVTDAVRAAGLKVGLHIHYNKVDRTDPYVTPVPDPRLHLIRRLTLARNVDARADTLEVQEDPAGCTLDKDRRILRFERELVEYETYSTDGRRPFRFLGCRRGQLGTRASAHGAGTPGGLLDVDTGPRFIRIDQNTDLADELAARIADFYQQTGPYDLVYFDGAEDVHVPFWYHTALAQYRVYRRLNPPPAVCESAHYTHFSWHMISRSNAYDAVATPEWQKDFCRLMPSRTAGARAMDFSRIDFGWLRGFGSSESPGPDVYEYVASRAAAWDCPLSLQISDLNANPRAEDCLAALRIWEEARLGNHLEESTRLLLRNVAPEDAAYVSCYEQRDTYENIRTRRNLTAAQLRILADRREHHLFINEQGRYEVVEISEVPAVAGGRVKAFVFTRSVRPRDAVAIIWAVKGDLRLEIPRHGVSAMRPFGAVRPVEATPGGTRLVVGPRTYVTLADTSPAEASRLLRAAGTSV